MTLGWAAIAPTRPRDPRRPADPRTAWSESIDNPLQQASLYHVRVLLQVSQTPAWVNSGHASVIRRGIPRT